ncbi:MAG: Pyridoxine/pyridoxamine 5'-phosphate oxidase [Bacteroidetes bacterium 38_7]|nr:MAG: Pyridoxine/pyridoxamine 5'-phosphate oxidase [Bacteroidetes bacterium 38_7]HAL65761.1 pyridoxamine 5'-phosphate oxidase [Bacteroidales bacterium]
MELDLGPMRRQYLNGQLNEADVKANPIEQFMIWFNEAISCEEFDASAFVLSTVSSESMPSGRVVLLKGILNEGFLFFTNYLSQKGKEIENNPFVAMTFFWPKSERQVRVKGKVEKLDKVRSLVYFHSRPRDSQIASFISPQSQVIESRQVIEEAFYRAQQQFSDKIPLPEFWGGFIICPLIIEFWQGRDNRLNDRLQYTLIDKQWIIQRLAP